MARITNKLNLPQQIVSAIMRDPYKADGDITATSLIQPPRIHQLRKRHYHEIVEDASDRIWALLGQVAHKILERADDTGAFHEERVGINVRDWLLTAGTDCYVTKQAIYRDDGSIEYEDIAPTIRDYKFTKVAAIRFPHEDWEQQLNVNAFIWLQLGFPVEHLEIVPIFRDWSKMQINREKDYPPPALAVPIKKWSVDKMREFIETRIYLHQQAQRLPDDILPFCTPAEQWKTDNKWAVKIPRRMSAVRVFTSHEEAEDFLKNYKKSSAAYIEFRPGTAIRCNNFCDVQPFCNQFSIEQSNERRAS